MIAWAPVDAVAGRPLEIRDIQIAGIVAARRGSLATRYTGHFDKTGVPLIDPWEDQAL